VRFTPICIEGYYEKAAADQVVVVRKLLKGSGAKGLACLVSELLTTSNGKIAYEETRLQPAWLVYPECVDTLVTKQEEPYEGRLSRTVV
jgi:hypothetical protein